MSNKPAQTVRQLTAENEELRARLEKAEETLRAIRTAEVDALVVATEQGERIFTLKGAEHSYRLLIEDMNEGAITLSLDGYILYCNRCFAETLKAPLEKVIGSTFRDWVTPGSQRILPELLQPNDAQPRRRAEVVLRASDGSVVSSHLSINDLHLEELSGYFCMVVTDLTEHNQMEKVVAAEKAARENLATSERSRRILLSMLEDQQQAQEALRASEAELRALFAAMRDVVIVYSREGRYLHIAPTDASLLYKPPAELVGKTLHAVLPAAQANRLLQHIQRALEIQQTVTLDYSLTLGGRELWFAGAISPLAGERVILVARDITDRKQTEAELQHLKEFNENIVQKMTEGIVVQEAGGDILFVNPAAAALLGYPPEALLGQSWTRIIPPDQQALVRAADERRARGESDRYELDLVRADGARLTVLVSAGPYHYDSRPTGALVVFTDITARKQAETALLQRNRELNALNRIGQALSRLLPLSELVALIYSTVGEVLDNRNFYLALYDEAAQALSFALYTVDGEQRVAPSRPLSNGITEHILHTRAPLLITHNMESALHERGIRAIGRGSVCYLGVPLLVGEKALGVIALQDYEHEQAYTARDGELLATIAAQAAIALQNARLFAETHERVEQLQALRTIDMAINASLDLRLTLNVVLEQAMRQLKFHAAAVLLLEPQAHTLHYAAGRGFRTRGIEHSQVRLGEGLAGRAALERQTLHVPNLTASETYFSRAALLKEEGFVTYQVVPLVAKGQTVGVLEVFQREQLNEDPEQLNFLETLAGQAAIAVDNARLFEGLQHANLNLLAAYDTTLEGWSRALDLRDKETEGHSQRVTDLTMQLAQSLGLTDDELVQVRRGALLHDIGKMGVPDAILLKPGKLTDDEWVVMKKHPQYAYDMLSPITYLRPALDIPYCHHEKWDGTGYPRGLKGAQIPLAARIFAVVDVWDALRSDRPYRPAWPPEKVFEHLRAGSGAHFDPAVVQAFLRMME